MILTSGILARDMNIKRVMVKDKEKKVLNNCIFIKGKGEKTKSRPFKVCFNSCMSA